MAASGINVGPHDARARRVAGWLAILGGLVALPGFFDSLGFLTWIVCAVMLYAGFVLLTGGLTEGTAIFGLPLVILAVLDAGLPLMHRGYWGLIGGAVLAIGAFTTARTRRCPINALLGVNTAGSSSAAVR